MELALKVLSNRRLTFRAFIREVDNLFNTQVPVRSSAISMCCGPIEHFVYKASVHLVEVQYGAPQRGVFDLE